MLAEKKIIASIRGNKEITGVRLLRDVYQLNDKRFGAKVNNLSMLYCISKASKMVLPGFCITFNLTNNLQDQISRFESEIKKHYFSLKKDAGTSKVIVRSSADLEDGENIVFPGVFESYSGINDSKSLMEAIVKCVDSAGTLSVKKYMRTHELVQCMNYYTVLVQPEFKSQYSGIAFSSIPNVGKVGDHVMIAQLVGGANHDLTRGVVDGNLYSFSGRDREAWFRCLKRTETIPQEAERQIFEALYRTMVYLKQIYHQELDVEWGMQGNRLVLFQVRKQTPHKNDLRNDTIHAFPMGQGLKYQAMQFFSENQLFSKKALFFPAGADQDEISSRMNELNYKGPITIRFSKKNERGLPRCFVSSPKEAFQQIEKYRENDWATIIHESINVQNSFELYLDNEKTILEHVPGMWESDSKLMSDIAYITEIGKSFWLANAPRLAKYEDNHGVKMEYVDPLSLSYANQFLDSIWPKIVWLRKRFAKDFPVNIHFVSDGQELQFLNCRLSEPIRWNPGKEYQLFKIQSLEDCEKYCGNSDILFSPNLLRGEEKSLSEYIPFLKKVSRSIYIEWGLLSHPAIQLREYGIDVIPQIINHQFYYLKKECK